MDISVLPTPTRCFCQIPLRELKRWATLKFVEHASTMTLLGLAKDRREREAVAIVALLDVPDEDVIRMMTPLAQPNCHVLECRAHVRSWLRDMLTASGARGAERN
jgi:hypothetical protein